MVTPRKCPNCGSTISGDACVACLMKLGLAENAGGSLGGGPAACVVTILAAVG